jgi:hypothetical protein
LTIKDDKELCDDLIVYTQEEKRWGVHYKIATREEEKSE